MAPTGWSWTDSNIARAGIYSESDVERMRDQLSGYATSVRHGLSDGFSSVQRQLPQSLGGGYSGYSGTTIYSSSPITPNEFPVALVAGLAVGGTGLLIFFIVLCCVCCKHKSGGRVLQAPSAPTPLSPASPHLNERHNPLSYTAPLYPMAPGPPSAYPAPVLAPYNYTVDTPTVAPDQPPAYDSDRPLLPAGGGAKAPAFQL